MLWKSRTINRSLIRSLAFLLFVGLSSTAFAKTKIDFQLLYEAAQISAQVYEGKSKIIGKFPGESAWVSTPGNTHVQYALIRNDKKKFQIIAVRGTANSANWDLNEDTRGVLDEKSGIVIHAGFLKAARIIYADAKPRLMQGYATYLTGHSLGGAVAAILGIYLQIDKIKLAGIYTFGQPRFTDLAGAKKYENLPLLRAIYQNDVVSLLPYETDVSDQKYAHIGAVVNLLSGPYYIYADADRAMVESPGLLKKFASQISIPDHKMKWYLEGLREKLNGAIEVKFKDRNKHIVRHQAGKQKGKPIKRSFNFNK